MTELANTVVRIRRQTIEHLAQHSPIHLLLFMIILNSTSTN